MRLLARWVGIVAIVALVVFCTSSWIDRARLDSTSDASGRLESGTGSADPFSPALTAGPSLRTASSADLAVDLRGEMPSDVERATGRLISGRVVDARTSTAVRGALIDFDGRARRDDVVVSAEDGSFSMSIPAECTRVTVSHARYQPQSWAPPRHSAENREPLSHDFALESDSMNAPLSIRARYADGRPAAGASFDVVARARLAIPLDRIAASTDASAYLAQLGALAGSVGVFESIDGEFPTRLDDSGEATIMVLAPVRVAVRVETDDAIGIGDVDVRCAPATLIVVLEPTWDLAIELREVSGPPPASVRIQVDGNDVPAEQEADSLYRARGLARTSDVRIAIRTMFDPELHGWLVPSVLAVLPPDDGRERRVELHFDEIVARTVRGTIRDAVTYEPLNARIAIRCSGGLPIPDEFAFEGRFTARVIPGAELLVLADGYEPASLTWWGSVDELGPIGLVPSATRSDRTRRGVLRGIVRGADAGPLENAVEVECVAIADLWRDTSFALPHGSFEFSNLPAGPYVVVARSGDQLARGHVVVDASAPAEVTLELHPREVVTIAAVDARSGAVVEGVWCGVGRPEFGRQVELVRGATTSVLVGGPGYDSRTVELDAADALDRVIRVELQPVR